MLKKIQSRGKQKLVSANHVASPRRVISGSDNDDSWCYRWFRTVHRPPRFRLTCLILSGRTSAVYGLDSLYFIVSECVRLSLFQINTTGPWLRFKTRLLCVNLWLADKPRLLLICFSVLFHMYEALKQNWNKTISTKQLANFVSVLLQF